MDSEILRLKERALLAIETGEGHFTEFKSGRTGPPGDKKRRNFDDLKRDVGRTLVAFANADGGTLLLGVEDDGQVTGVDISAEDMEELLYAPSTAVHQDTPLPPVRKAKISIQGKTVVFFSIAKGTSHVYLTSDGRCLQRRDLESVPISSEKIRFTRQEEVSREYDRTIIDSAQISDLDLEQLGEVAEHVSKGMSVEKCLQYLELAEFDGTSIKLRRAALLLFAKEPAKWHPRLQVRVLRVLGSEIKTGDSYNVDDDKVVSHNILSLIDASWEVLRPHLSETRMSDKALFQNQIIYPERACREALVNAIAHRDYSNEGRGIEIRVFADRLDVVSPGELLSSISIEDLVQETGIHESRNTHVSRVLRELGYMRELGEGIRRIFELMRANDLTPPVLRSNSGEFTVTLSHRLVYTPEEKIWLENFATYDLRRDERTVVRLGYGSRTISPKEIWDACGIVDTDYYRRLLESLYAKGILYRKVSRQDSIKIAQKQGMPRKSLPQFGVRVPTATKTSKPRQTRAAQDETLDESSYETVVVRNIPFRTTEERISRTFSRYGEVEDVRIPTARGTTRNRGYCFVEYSSQEAAAAAISDSGRLTLGGRKLHVRPDSRSKRRRVRTQEEAIASVRRPGSGRRVFIANLPPSTRESDLLDVLAEYGPVVDIRVPLDHASGKRRAFGFVTFANLDDAKAAIADSGRIMLKTRVLYLQEYVEGDSR